MNRIQRLLPKSAFLLLLLIVLHTMAQPGDTVHAIAKGETLSGLAKRYHTTVGDIMRLNGMDSKSILHIGQKVKIPSNSVRPNAVTQRNSPATTRQPAPAAEPKQVEQTPVTPASEGSTSHVVGKKETLYGISKKYHVTVDQIKTWNHLSGNNIHEGQQLIINGGSVSVADAGSAVVEKQPVAAVTPQPQQSVPQNTPAKNNQAVESNVSPATSSSPVIQPVAREEDPGFDSKNVGETGYFAPLYHQGHQELTGDAATFKTASGWLDKKYYVLVNNIDAGTIVRVSVNNKVVFAKVLGPLPDIKEDNGLLLRISNAAASSLGLVDPKFPVSVNY